MLLKQIAAALALFTSSSDLHLAAGSAALNAGGPKNLSNSESKGANSRPKRSRR